MNTFEEWSATLIPFESKALTRKEIFAAGAASRDAEIAELVAALEYIAVDDCGCGVPCDCYSWYTLADKAKEALAKVRNP